MEADGRVGLVRSGAADPIAASPASPPTVAPGSDVEFDDAGAAWRRHPADVARLVLAVAVLAASLLLTALDPDSAREVSADLVRLVRRLPLVVRDLLLGLTQMLAVVAPLAALAALARTRRWRLLLTTVGAAAAAAVIVSRLEGWLDRVAPPLLFRDDSFVTGDAFPSGAYLAGLAAAAFVISPQLPRRWRRVLFGGVGIATLARVLTAAVVPLNVVTQLSLGAAVGAVVLVIGGAPMRRLSRADLGAGLFRLGLGEVRSLRELDPGRHGARLFRARTDDGEVVLKVVGRDARDADLLVRIVKRLRFKGIEDERPGWSPERLVEHEALVTSLASAAGVPVAPVMTVGATADGDGLLVLEPVAGRRPGAAGEEDAVAVDDDVARAMWACVAALRRRRIAHRWCSAGQFVVDAPDVRLLDHRWATIGADDQVLALDVANLAVDLAARLGARRAVELGVEAIGAEAVAGALPYVQPRLLTTDVRAAAKARPELLDEVRTAIREVTGVDEVPLAEVRRVTGRSVLSLVVAAFLVYMGLSFAANWSDMVDALRAADWTYLPLLLVFAAAGYPAGAMSLMGAVPPRLPLGETTQVMLAQTFLNRFTPANAGGMALRARYLQRRGVDLAVAATGIGLTSAASGAAQVVLIVVFVLWAGSSTTGLTDFSVPDSSLLALVVVIVLVVLGVVLLTPWGRRRVWTPALRSLRHVVDDLRELARSPAKMAMLFGGALLGKLATILAFVVSCEMLGADLSFAEYGVLYMTANTVASAAPTPGGLGALEAALLVALTGRGVPSDQAFASVVVFRLATYWLPTLPSWLMLRHVRRAGIV